jgi:hypothetical protein
MDVRLAFYVVIALLLCAAPAHAQTDTLSGHWSGIITEPRSQNFPAYTLSVHLGADEEGRPVGIVQYDAFPCAGVWTFARMNGQAMRFNETIVDGVDQCAQHVVVELTPRVGGLDVRLWPVGGEAEASTGRLRHNE